MRVYFILLIFVLGILFACQQKEEVCVVENEVSIPKEAIPVDEYDSTYAARLGADDYGMKSYVMAFLKAGPNRDRDSAASADLQRAHLDNIHRLAEEGKLVLAGPFLHDGELRGIYVFDVETVEEAEELTDSDPAIQAGSLVMELIPWYGSAALMEVNGIHARIQKTSF